MKTHAVARTWVLGWILTTAACIGDDDIPSDAGVSEDALSSDLGIRDASPFTDATSQLSDAAPQIPDAAPPDLGVLDAGTLDASPYAPARWDGSVPSALTAASWKAHWIEDIRPFWASSEATGVPEGNYPTYRFMDGTVSPRSERRPRMMGRQIYVYSMGYLLTGEPQLLSWAHSGVRWLIDHAKDTTRGGWYAQLDANGLPLAGLPKLTQDTSYVLLGLAAYHFVTRDPEVEAELLAARDLLFDGTKYWDETRGRLRDGLDETLAHEFDVEGDGGSELVAQLDPLNAFLLLSQPVLQDAARRAQFLADSRRLAEVIVRDFYQAPFFFGIDTNRGRFGTKHVDFGHILKSYWMLLQLDKRLPDHPFRSIVANNVHGLLDMAFDGTQGLWAKRPTSASAVEYGSDWWIYAELDQITATLDLLDWRYVQRLASTGAGWKDKYVDRTYAVREVIPGINRQGARVYNWPRNDTAKCNEWKSGFHSTEHALVMYIHGAAVENQQMQLHFAVPTASTGTFIAVPYTFLGREVSRTQGDEWTLGGTAVRSVQVDFADVY